MKGIRWKTVEYGDDRLDWFFFSLSHQRKRQRWRKQGEGERGFLVAAHIRGCHRDCGKREQFLLSRVNEYYTSDRLNSIKNRIQDLYDISCTIFNEYYILSKQINLIIGFVNGKH